ncbi:DUF2937 family protein [Arenicella xantha]|uniref:DUF2937 family protein n=1 Tax=Arenicella xantha TaxID=644221 RepID=A0A395JS76_9GAMM|nr:DUF2937 family protein [Arenicella xantha]RBP53192.1 DUF2937 family protein [Arenicella xantha]
MKRLFEYFRLALFVGGVLIGVQVPSFVDQYGQRLAAHTLESDRGLKDFQRDADTYFDGDLQRLITHYQANPDQIINNGGRNIATLYARNKQLQQALTAFSASRLSPYVQTFLNPVSEIRSQAIASYDFTIALNQDAIIAGLLTGLLIGLCLELLLSILKLMFIRPNQNHRPHRPRRSI